MKIGKSRNNGMSKVRIFFAKIPVLTKIGVILFAVVFSFFWKSEREQASITEGKGPTLKVDEEVIEVSVSDPESVLLKGVTASDDRDGDVTDTVVVENISTFVNDRTRNITYVTFDSDQHVGRITRKLYYTDYIPPKFFLTAPLEFPVGTSSIIDNLTASDSLDGDITSQIKILPGDRFNLNEPGVYPVTFQVSNSAGDTRQIDCDVVIYDGSAPRGPQIGLTSYLLYLEVGADFDPYQYLDQITIGGRKYDLVEGYGNYANEEREKDEKVVVGYRLLDIENPVDTSKKGFYQVKYSMTVDAGNQETVTGTRRLIVVVR